LQIDWKESLGAAEREAGLSDWGGDRFQEGLRVYAEAINRESALPELGRQGVRAQIHANLVQRLRLYRDRRAYPEIERQRIERPLIVIGLPRSGTTFLHALLAQDPRARSPLSWEVSELSPPPRSETYGADPRVAPLRAQLEQLPLAFRQMHMVGAQLPEECNSITSLAFQSSNLSAPSRIPSYVDWYLSADDASPYMLHRHALQHLQAFCARDWWVLKSPPHMFHLPRLLKTYPDARIVFPHRDPAATLPSLASLIAFLRRGAYGEVDAHAIGREMASYWKEALDRALAFRADPANNARFADVRYNTLLADPLGSVRSVYDHFGIVLTPEAQDAMQTFLDAQPQGKHGAHHYTLEEFGLRKDRIHEDFAGYIGAYL
jgi:hypothetical protein